MKITKFQDKNRIKIIATTLIAIVVVGAILYFIICIRFPFGTKYDIPDVVYNQIKTAKPNGLRIIKISKYEQGMLIYGKAKENKQIALFMTAISNKGIGIPVLQSVTKSNCGNSFILMVSKNK